MKEDIGGGRGDRVRIQACLPTRTSMPVDDEDVRLIFWDLKALMIWESERTEGRELKILRVFLIL